MTREQILERLASDPRQKASLMTPAQSRSFIPLFVIILIFAATASSRLGAMNAAARTLGPFSTPAEIRAASAKSSPGDVLLMAEGKWADADLVFEGRGTAAAPVTLKANTPGKTILTGNSRLHIAGEYLVVDGLRFAEGYLQNAKAVVEFRNGSKKLASHCRLTNCAIEAFNPPDPMTTYMWIAVYGRFNRVDHCRLAGMNHKGVTLAVVPTPVGPPNETRIDHNYFGERPRGTENGYETIRIGTSDVSQEVSRAVVEENYFIHCDGEIEMISNKTCENVYRGNTFVDNKGQLSLRHGKRCRVEGNFFFGYGASNASGVRIIDAGHVVINNYFAGLKGSKARGAVVLANGIPNSPLNGYWQVKDALVAFNTFVDCRDSIVIGNVEGTKKATLPPEDCTIANNIVVGKTGPLVKMIEMPEKMKNMKFEGNIMFGAEAGAPATAGIRVVDPKLVEGKENGYKIFRPGAESPAVNAAVGDYPDVTEDMDGQPRNDGRKDVGADERSEAKATRHPLTPEDVGPEWMRGK